MTQKIDSKFFENVICINCLKNKTYFTKLSDIYEPSYFEDKGVRMILDMLFEHHSESGKTLSLTELRTLLTDKEKIDLFAETIKKLQANGWSDTFDPEELLTNTEQFFKEKAVCQAVLDTTDKLSENKIDTSDILAQFEKACNLSLIDNMGFEYFKQIDEHIEYLKTPQKHISTGWKWLDKMLNGGWLATGRALYVFTGWTNVGKSIFLGNAALNLLKANKNVLVISLEMTEQIYAHRLSSQLTQVPYNDLPFKTDKMKELVLKFKDENKDAKIVIKEFPTGKMTVEHMNAYIHNLIKKGFKPDAIVLDYINLIKPSKSYKGNGTYEEIKKISENLRASTYEFEIPIITATQLNRSGAGKSNPGMQSISESVGLSFTADVQMAIWRNEDDGPTGFVHLGMQKNRYGPNFGSCVFRLDTNTLLLIEQEKKDESESSSGPTATATATTVAESAETDLEKYISATVEQPPADDEGVDNE